MTTNISQNAKKKALEILFASAARAKVLHLFMLDPMRAYYQRQIEAATGLPIRAVQRELERLNSMELLFRRTEGNRTYYQVDIQFPLFPELRSMVLKSSDDADRLRGEVAMDDAVTLAFLCESEKRALIVSGSSKRPALHGAVSYSLEIMNSEAFLQALGEKREQLEPFLVRGVDLLGRREDVIWRRIEAAGYTVRKGKGVA